MSLFCCRSLLVCVFFGGVGTAALAQIPARPLSTRLAVTENERLKSGQGTVDGGSGKPTEYVRVEVRGKLKTGIVVIGGETTGTTITAGNITWELDFARNRKLAELAKTLNGQTVVVKGTLRLKRGVERKTRWIVTVRSLQGGKSK